MVGNHSQNLLVSIAFTFTPIIIIRNLGSIRKQVEDFASRLFRTSPVNVLDLDQVVESGERELDDETVPSQAIVLGLPPAYVEPTPRVRHRLSAFRRRILYTLRQHHCIDDYPHTAENERIIRRKVETIVMQLVGPDSRPSDNLAHITIVTKTFFIPTDHDVLGRDIQHSHYARKRKQEYDRWYWLGFRSWFEGRSLYVGGPQSQKP